MSVSRASGRGRLVYYEICISLIFLTLRRPTAIHELAPGESGVLRGLPYTVLTALFGWWGIPWGFIYTPLALWTNLSGGRELLSAEDSFLDELEGQEEGHEE
jgi:hypothetical protein